MTEQELELLRAAWARAVKIDHSAEKGPRAATCWFHVNRPELEEHGVDVGPCEGWIEGAHWIKRQRVEAILGAALPDDGTPMLVNLDDEAIWTPGATPTEYGPDFYIFDGRRDLIHLAAWDDRNGVPACERHHRRFDSHRMPPLVVPRALVPAHVTEFCTDWGLETALEDRNPA